MTTKTTRRRTSLPALITSLGIGLIVAGTGCGGQERVARKSGPKVVPAVDFASEILPIFSNRCFKCHGPDQDARQAGLRFDLLTGATATLKSGSRAVVPGEPAASELLRRIRPTDAAKRMPPPGVGEALSDRETDLLRRWIAEGASWGEHWSLRPLVNPSLPAAEGRADIKDSIDRFLAARLAAESLAAAPEAKPEVLLRRASLDLTGLPPTPEETDAFFADTKPGAYERLVDRLLASPRFGEHWARWWSDLARYADTKGYEKDDRRTVWPWRDWVIRAFNADMPFDRFATLQLAGDLLPGASDDDRLATAFHRHTMTNDEGGTDDEEFRVAAVVDRVNTTGEIFLGLTIACAQCHTHKYDPITQTDYFRLFAVFNTTADADRDDDAPTMTVRPEPVARRVAERRKELTAAAEAAAADPGAATAVDRPWLDDELPRGAQRHVEGFGKGWPWTDLAGAAPPKSGRRCFGGGGSKPGPRQAYLTNLPEPLVVTADDRLYVHVFVNAAAPPEEIVFQWFSAEEGWAHRACFGRNTGAYGGVEGTPSRRRLGPMPEAGLWTRIEIDPSTVGLAGRTVTGAAFSQSGGEVWFDDAGLKTTAAKRIAHELAALDRPQAEDVRVPILAEQPAAERRKTRRFRRGSFLDPAEDVDPGVPAFLTKPADAPITDRLALAGRLFSRDNPLTPRVLANRFWERMFGTGLVETLEDFGVQGAPPSHPELLDHLAASLRDDGYRLKPFLRRIAVSAAYRRDASTTPAALARDPKNRLYARAPRPRLDAEQIRDQALAVAGLLAPLIGGPPVFPPQPPGVWNIIYSSDDWRTSTGPDRYRRGMYTFFRRTSPYPAFQLFDAPPRDVCSSRRIRTNTPLQAYVTLNDPAFVETAQAFARRVIAETRGGVDARITRAYRLLFQRPPATFESERLAAFVSTETQAFRADHARAVTAATDPLGPLPAGADVAEFAAWTLAASALLNLDEALTRP